MYANWNFVRFFFFFYKKQGWSEWSVSTCVCQGGVMWVEIFTNWMSSTVVAKIYLKHLSNMLEIITSATIKVMIKKFRCYDRLYFCFQWLSAWFL